MARAPVALSSEAGDQRPAQRVWISILRWNHTPLIAPRHPSKSAKTFATPRKKLAVDAPTPKTGFGRPRFSSDYKSSSPRDGDEPHREPGLASGHIAALDSARGYRVEQHVEHQHACDKEFQPRYARARKSALSAQLRRHRFPSLFGGTTGGSRFFSRRVDRFLVVVPQAVEHQVVEFPMDLTGDLAVPFGGVESGQSFCHPRRQRMPNPLSKESKSWICPGTCRRGEARTRAISIQLGENAGRGQAPSPPWYRRGATRRDGV